MLLPLQERAEVVGAEVAGTEGVLLPYPCGGCGADLRSLARFRGGRTFLHLHHPRRPRDNSRAARHHHTEIIFITIIIYYLSKIFNQTKKLFLIESFRFE